jgi:pyruvate dehydrogenase E2 component (dihydrolipoamide acetyltransferase)
MMRFTIVLVLCCIVSFTFAQPGQAKNQPAPQAAAPAASAPVKEKPAIAERGVAKVMAGPITGIDSEKKTISIKVKSGTYAVSIDEKTVVLAGDKQIAVADLKQGDRVHVEYQKLSNGQRKAVHINAPAAQSAPVVKSQPAPRQEAAAPKAEATPAPAKAVTKANPAPAPAKVDVKTGAAAAPKTEAKADTAAAQPAAKAKEASPVK